MKTRLQRRPGSTRGRAVPVAAGQVPGPRAALRADSANGRQGPRPSAYAGELLWPCLHLLTSRGEGKAWSQSPYEAKQETLAAGRMDLRSLSCWEAAERPGRPDAEVGPETPSCLPVSLEQRACPSSLILEPVTDWRGGGGCAHGGSRGRLSPSPHRPRRPHHSCSEGARSPRRKFRKAHAGAVTSPHWSVSLYFSQWEQIRRPVSDTLRSLQVHCFFVKCF